jgi:hypothetical protein
MGHKDSTEFIQAFRVLIVKPANQRAIEIENTKQALAVE